ncbi:MAG: nuclear transport factor 2 family protein [Acidimicrobiia bacterium]
MSDQLKKELLELENGFWQAAGNPGFYGDHFAEDGAIALAMGIMGKTEVMQAMEAARPWATYDLQSPRLIEISQTVAALVYRASARRASDDHDHDVVISSVYVRRRGEWQLIVHQQTPC